MKDQYDQIAEVDTIVEKDDVEKFNPWHDARGRFTTAGGGGGRGSFSANPKTKAGQLAIQRAYNAGKNTTFNRHKESKGENVHQNMQWIQSAGNYRNRRVNGKPAQGSFRGNRQKPGYNKPTSGQGLNSMTNTFTTSKPTNYLQGTGSSSKPKQQTTSKPAASKPKTTTTSKPKTTQSKPASTSKPKQTNKPAAGAKKPSTSHKTVDGKDMSKKVDTSNLSRKKAMDYVARQQGYKGQGRVVKNRTEFQDAVKKSGVVMYRTLGDGTDIISGRTTKASKFIDYMKTGSEDQLSLNGSGGSVYGQGIYAASTKITPGKKPSRKEQMKAAEESIDYQWRGQGKTVAMTLDPSAKVAKYDDIYSEFNRLSRSEQNKYSGDMGVYAAAKGYDAMTTLVDRRNQTYYTMVYNRTKMVFYDTTYDNMLPSDLGYNDTRMPVGAF